MDIGRIFEWYVFAHILEQYFIYGKIMCNVICREVLSALIAKMYKILRYFLIIYFAHKMYGISMSSSDQYVYIF